MPFQSKSQMRMAFSGRMGSEMKDRAKKWADETPHKDKMPEHKRKKTMKMNEMMKRMSPKRHD